MKFATLAFGTTAPACEFAASLNASGWLELAGQKAEVRATRLHRHVVLERHGRRTIATSRDHVAIQVGNFQSHERDSLSINLERDSD